MAMQSKGKDAKGRNYDQTTKDGSSSAATYGTGATGDIGAGGAQDPEQGQAGNRQSGPTRTDDLLTDGSDGDADGGFVREEAGELQTGMGGIGSLSTGNAGSRQASGRTPDLPDERNLGRDQGKGGRSRQ